MLHIALAIAILQGPSPIERDAYGVPHIYGPTWEDAFYYAGRAVAEDRLWQMETTRRIARGTMAEVLGAAYAAADREVLRSSYSDAELQQQFDAMSARAKSAFTQYAKGVNAWIDEAKKGGKLPAEYAKSGFSAQPWTVLDSVAVTIRLWHLFGRGGAGELRNLAIYTYLQSQPCKDKALDVMDDFGWQNDPESITTIAKEDDPLAENHPKFPRPTREQTEKHLGLVPKLNLLELLPGIRLAERQESSLVAEKSNVFYKTGSYAIVVGPKRSATGVPLLLSAPQMGFRNPSMVHEMSISAPGIAVSGMDVPGIPGVLIGYTPRVAWALTSGIADTEDVFFFKADGPDGYVYAGERKKLDKVVRTLKVKGAPNETVTQQRTMWGPVVLTTKANGGAVFVRRSTYRMEEMKAFEALVGIYGARDADDIQKAAAASPMTFNLLYATAEGQTGYAYLGAVPIRAEAADPRFPTPAEPAFNWQGVIPFAKMPHVVNPASGLLFNWNNKPVAWWPNLDTPVWGRLNGTEALANALTREKLGITDLELAAWTIARTDATLPHFGQTIADSFSTGLGETQDLQASRYLSGFDGRLFEGSQGATLYLAWLDALREELFAKATGNFISPDYFRMIAQPSVVWNALHGKTSYDYLQGRKPTAVSLSAFKKAVERLKSSRGDDPSLWTYSPPNIPTTDGQPIPYSNRGTYIQVVEMGSVPRGRSVLTPGVAEAGPHSTDQVSLARAWTYKRMFLRPGDLVTPPPPKP